MYGSKTISAPTMGITPTEDELIIPLNIVLIEGKAVSETPLNTIATKIDIKISAIFPPMSYERLLE